MPYKTIWVQYNTIKKVLKKKHISRSPIHQWPCCTWEWESDISIANVGLQAGNLENSRLEAENHLLEKGVSSYQISIFVGSS